MGYCVACPGIAYGMHSLMCANNGQSVLDMHKVSTQLTWSLAGGLSDQACSIAPWHSSTNQLQLPQGGLYGPAGPPISIETLQLYV